METDYKWRTGVLDKSTLQFLKCIRTGMAPGCETNVTTNVTRS